MTVVCYWCGAKDTLADVGKELDDGKYKMVQCSKCKNAYYVLNKEKMNKPKPMTNEEWFASLSTEEKARFLACEFTVACDDYAYSNNKETWNERYWLAWLKQPHTPKE